MKILCQDRKTLIPEAEGTGKRFTNRINCLRTALHKLLGPIFGTRIPVRDKHVAPLVFLHQNSVIARPHHFLFKNN